MSEPSLRHSLLLNSNQPDLWFALGLLCHQEGRLHDAVCSYDKAIALRPSFAEAHNNRGVALSQLQRRAEALQAFDLAVRYQPNYAEAHNNYGALLTAMGRLDEALTQLERALALKSDYAEAHDNLAACLVKKGGLDEAIAHGRAAVSLKCDYQPARKRLVKLLGQRAEGLASEGKLAEAALHLQEALELKPDDEQLTAQLAEVERHVENVPHGQPTLWGMASSFTKSMATFAGLGFQRVSLAVHSDRLKECRGCEHHGGARCSLCGCFTLAKAWLPHENCPIGKWAAISPV